MRRNPMMYYLAGTVLLLLVGSLCAGCGTTTTPTITYNIHFETGAFRVADTVTVEPGQGGDATDASEQGATASGGESLSPGQNVVIKGFADQGNIINIGTSTPSTSTPTTTATTDATVDATVTP